MIISASRRTDIPAFYNEWFMNRVRDGFCTVPNPFNSRQIARVSLDPEDVDAIVFWTRNPLPLMSSLEELDQRGFCYYFHFTLLGYPRFLDQNVPSFNNFIENFRALSGAIGADRVIWRYDPIVITPRTGISFHLENFERIADSLKDHTNKCVISLVDMYRKSKRRLGELANSGEQVIEHGALDDNQFDSLMRGIAGLGKKYGLTVSSCAESIDLTSFGINPGRCIDHVLLQDEFNIRVPARKDPGQRDICACVVSKDIGMYDSCLYGCQYCYATSSISRARDNFVAHDPSSPSLLGWHEADQVPQGNRGVKSR
jgi:hypothetical protein